MFTSVKTNKISEHIVEQIRQAILYGRLKPGDRLPPEKELMDRFGLSKATLREALRSLEVLGFLVIRKGAAGGALVTEVNLEKARDCFFNFLHFKNLSLQDLSEVRLLLEPYIAEKTAHSITREDLDQLGKLIEEYENALIQAIPIPSEYRKNEIEFHRIIWSAPGNPILLFIVDFVENLLLDTKEILKPDKYFFRKVLNSHKRIYKALLERDGKKAGKELIGHIREVEKNLVSLQQKVSRIF